MYISGYGIPVLFPIRRDTRSTTNIVIEIGDEDRSNKVALSAVCVVNSVDFGDSRTPCRITTNYESIYGNNAVCVYTIHTQVTMEVVTDIIIDIQPTANLMSKHMILLDDTPPDATDTWVENLCVDIGPYAKRSDIPPNRDAKFKIGSTWTNWDSHMKSVGQIYMRIDLVAAPPKPKVATATFNVEPHLLYLVDEQTGLHRYIGLESIGSGTAMSSEKTAMVMTGDYVVKCINQYKDHPLCDQQMRCHATFQGIPQAGHEQNCSCGACGYDFTCI